MPKVTYTAGASAAPGATNPWILPADAVNNNESSPAFTNALPAAGVTADLDFSTFSASGSIPAGATIVGFVVNVTGRADIATVKDNSLVVNFGGATTGNLMSGGTWPLTSGNVQAYGSPIALSGGLSVLTPAMITTIAAVLSLVDGGAGGGKPQVSYFTIDVYYDWPGASLIGCI